MTSPPGGPASTILHVDMDAFFASVELVRRPELRGQPVVVGGKGARGVVAAASYEARAFGIHSAMPSARAQRLCPHAVFLPGDYSHYAAVSHRVMAIFGAFTPLVEPLSLDEAFLDVTGASRLFGSGEEIGRAIRRRVRDEESLACSVGVATTKFVAKLASEEAKPRASLAGPAPGEGVHVVAPGTELAFLHPLPVSALWGVGPATRAKLSRLGVTTIADVAALPESALVSALGSAAGTHLHRLALGIDPRAVEPAVRPKSVSHEETFPRDHHGRASLNRELVRLGDAVAGRLRHQQLAGRTVTLKVRFGDFRTITRSVTLPAPVSAGPAVAEAAKALLAQVDPAAGVRLIGVAVSHLGDDHVRQLTFDDAGAPSWDEATEAIDRVRDRFGADAVVPATLAGPDGVRVKSRGDQQWGPDNSG